jgi:hypothetical protein
MRRSIVCPSGPRVCVVDDNARHESLRLGPPAYPGRKPARCAACVASATRCLPARPIRTNGASAGGAALPNFLWSRRVDQIGRKSETALRIASLHFELSALSGAATDQLELPSGAPDARHRQWG